MPSEGVLPGEPVPAPAGVIALLGELADNTAGDRAGGEPPVEVASPAEPAPADRHLSRAGENEGTRSPRARSRTRNGTPTSSGACVYNSAMQKKKKKL